VPGLYDPGSDLHNDDWWQTYGDEAWAILPQQFKEAKVVNNIDFDSLLADLPKVQDPRPARTTVTLPARPFESPAQASSGVRGEFAAVLRADFRFPPVLRGEPAPIELEPPRTRKGA